MANMMVTQADITNTIKEKGISNKVVCLHSSLKSFGYVEGGADAIIQAFLHEGCTLVVPTFSNYYYQIERNEMLRQNHRILKIYIPLLAIRPIKIWEQYHMKY